MSIGVNPLMHWASSPFPTLRMYCNITHEESSYMHNCMINVLFKYELQQSKILELARSETFSYGNICMRTFPS